MCVIFIHERQDLQFKVGSELQIFEKLFMAILFSFRVFTRNLLSGCHQEIFLFWYLTWSLNRGFKSNKPTHYLIDYGDFKYGFCFWILIRPLKLLSRIETSLGISGHSDFLRVLSQQMSKTLPERTVQNSTRFLKLFNSVLRILVKA